jgi:hypothetical protein
MPSNKWTQQTPKANNSIRLVLAQRVFIAPTPQVYADPTKLNGADPAAPWVDLGIVAGSKVNMTYNKEVKYIETGIEKVRRGAYITGKTATATFDLEQFDMGVLESISGLTKTTITGGAKIHIGQEDLVEKALLFVGTNKIDGKEHHYFTNKGSIVWTIEEQEDSRILRVTADLYSFLPSGETLDAYFSMYVLD